MIRAKIVHSWEFNNTNNQSKNNNNINNNSNNGNSNNNNMVLDDQGLPKRWQLINLPCCVLDVVPGETHAGSTCSLLIGWFEKPLCHDGWSKSGWSVFESQVWVGHTGMIIIPFSALGHFFAYSLYKKL